MGQIISDQEKRDPGSITQAFKDFSIKLYCCRYWMMEAWECSDLKLPIWRLYHNTLSGSYITFRDQIIPLNCDKIVIIPPNTSFSSQLTRTHPNQESIIGRNITPNDSFEKAKENSRVDHLFVHFSLGFPFDLINNEIFEIPVTPFNSVLLKEVKKSCMTGRITGLKENFLIKQLIFDGLLQLPEHTWEYTTQDIRMCRSLQYIQANVHRKISNEELADHVNMATNSFARLFKSSVGISTQQYVLQLKIQASCKLMLSTEKSMGEIADSCGFSDRHHFSKIFKKVLKMNPACYRKTLH